MLSLVGPTGVVESSLEAPSSSADVRVCIQNWFCFGDLRFCLEFVWVTRRYIAEPIWGIGRTGVWGWLRLYVCYHLSV
jgi:hypothetical protein